ncbi:MAG: sigma-70 family RNA polymerase sigma factor, partial [Leptolyngbyaceae cyanobacterium RM1_405_57]|nr:sigma-70 family RNA polymerase sigma factor [Leptolyngbyaceae cyanobacterium RM1_405_57]
TTEGSVANPLEQVSMNERSQFLREALARLPDLERQVLEIAYYEGLSQSEVAKRLNIPLGTVKTRTRQGLLKLRQHLQDFIQ